MVSQPAKSPTLRRILREAQEISNAPSTDYHAIPLETDLFEWHFTIKGPPNSVYSEGIYHGRIVLPPTYPLRPPSFRFVTPSGRFEVNREICLSISGHHEETWQPAWGIRTALVALRSFMETDPKGQLGGLESSDAVRRRLATASQSFKCPVCEKTNFDIIAEATRAAKPSSSENEHVVVPPDLRMGWKDELGQKRIANTKSTESIDVGIASSRKPVVPVTHSSSKSQLSTVSMSVPAATEKEHAPESAVNAPAEVERLSVQSLYRRGTTAPTVPPWVDRAIVVLAVVLAGALAKVLVSA